LAETLDQAPVVAVAAAVPALFLLMAGRACERAFEAFARSGW
jgi:hypothetical protein